MTSIVPRLNRTYTHGDDRYPVVIQVIRSRQKREFQTPYLMSEAEFETFLTEMFFPLPKKKSKKGEPAEPKAISPRQLARFRQIHQYLLALQEDLRDICRQLLQSKGESYTAEDISSTYHHRGDLSQFFVYAYTLIGNLQNTNRAGTAANYLSACRSLETFLNSRTLSFEAFTPELIDRYVASLHANNLQTNTCVFYLRQLRAIYNKALKEGIMDVDLHPFRNHVLKEEKTRKRFLTREEAQHISRADLTNCHPDISFARDLFMASLYLRGMAFVDLCRLTRQNIEGDYLYYKRQKSKQSLCIFIEKPLRNLIDRYAVPGSPYLFPLIQGEDIHRECLNARKRIGRRIHELGLIAGTKAPLTFYVVRHTWATQARDLGVSLPAISSCMGHTSEKTTRIYLAELDLKVLNDANRKVIKALT